MTSRQEIDDLFKKVQETIIDHARAKQNLLSQLTDALRKYTPEGERKAMTSRIFTYLDQLSLQATNARVMPLDELMKRPNKNEIPTSKSI